MSEDGFERGYRKGFDDGRRSKDNDLNPSDDRWYPSDDLRRPRPQPFPFKPRRHPDAVPFPTAPKWPGPDSGDPKCPVCGISFKYMTHYVCPRTDCPSRVSHL